MSFIDAIKEHIISMFDSENIIIFQNKDSSDFIYNDIITTTNDFLIYNKLNGKYDYIYCCE